MTTKEVLVKARGLIERPENWTVGVRVNGQGAHCALGAIDAARGTYAAMNDPAVETLAALISDEALVVPDKYNEQDLDNWPIPRVAHYNNTHSHECVLAWFDAAIEKAS